MWLEKTDCIYWKDEIQCEIHWDTKHRCRNCASYKKAGDDMMNDINYLYERLNIKTIIRQNMKTLRISFDEEQCCILVRHNGCCTNDFVNQYIEHFLEQNYDFLINYLNNYTHSNNIILWGEIFELKTHTENFVDYDNNIIYLTNINNNKLLNQLYKKELMNEINKIKDIYENKIQAYPNEWKIRKVKKYWGQSTRVKNNKEKWHITINRDIIKKPKECLKEVMIHELCHYYHWNHGPEFQKLLTQHCPNWKEIELKNNL